MSEPLPDWLVKKIDAAKSSGLPMSQREIAETLKAGEVIGFAVHETIALSLPNVCRCTTCGTLWNYAGRKPMICTRCAGDLE